MYLLCDIKEQLYILIIYVVRLLNNTSIMIKVSKIDELKLYLIIKINPIINIHDYTYSLLCFCFIKSTMNKKKWCKQKLHCHNTKIN